MNPSGGLPRRKTIVDQVRKADAPALVLDSGNALFKSAAETGEASRAKAELILRAMGELGYSALAVGPRDLAQGLGFLEKTAKAAKVPLLSANLVDASGKKPFAASRTLVAGERKIGVIGVSPAGTYPRAAGLQGQPPIAAALEEAKRLRKSVELVVVLAPIPYEEAMALLQQADGSIDFIVQSYEGRGASSAQRQGTTHLFGPGERGRSMAKMTLDLGGKGALADRGEVERLAERVRLLAQNEKELEKRIAATTDASAKKSLEDMRGNFRGQRKALEEAGGKLPKDARVFSIEHVSLGPEVASDPTLEKAIQPYASSGGH